MSSTRFCHHFLNNYVVHPHAHGGHAPIFSLFLPHNDVGDDSLFMACLPPNLLDTPQSIRLNSRLIMLNCSNYSSDLVLFKYLLT